MSSLYLYTTLVIGVLHTVDANGADSVSDTLVLVVLVHVMGKSFRPDDLSVTARMPTKLSLRTHLLSCICLDVSTRQCAACLCLSLRAVEHLRYAQLYAFDRELNQLDSVYNFSSSPHQVVSEASDSKQVIVAERGPLLFVFNFSPTHDYVDMKVRCSRSRIRLS